MGIIGDAFRKLFDVIWGVILWIGSLIRSLFQSLIDLLMAFFEVIYALVYGLFYLLFQIGLIAVKIFLIFFEVGKLLLSLVVGFAKTLGSLSYTSRSSSGNGYSEMIGNIFSAAEPLQLNVIAYIILFVLWFGTAISAMKLLSSIRVGGD